MDSEMDQVHHDTSGTCRSCKSESEELTSVFEFSDVAEENPRIDEMLMACTAVQVKKDDGLPTKICTSCHNQLKSWYAFKKLCQEVDSSLREYVKSTKSVETPAEIPEEIPKEPPVPDIKEEGPNRDFSDMLNLNDSVSDEGDGNRHPEDCSSTRSDFIEFLDNNQMILTCRECSKVFTTLEGLRSHKRIHSGVLFKCKICAKGFTRQTHVYRHELSHGKHKLHVCRICNKTLTRMEHLRRHLTTHLKDKKYCCQSCNRGFNRSDHLDAHVARCRGDRVHICDICNRGFAREDSLQVHKRLHANQAPVLPTLENIDNIEEHYYEIDHDPNADFSNNSDLEDCFEPHVEVSENVDEEDNDDDEDYEEVLTLNTTEDDLIKNEEKQLTEDSKDIIDTVEESMDVGNEPPDDSDSTDSEYLPTKPTPKVKRGRGRPRKNPPKYKSKRPSRRRPSVKSEPGLEVPEDVVEEEEDDKDEVEGDFPCEICNRVLSKRGIFERHMRHHQNAKVHTCKMCKKEFSRYNHLKRHMTTHAVVKPFECGVCFRRFTRRDHLRQHSRLHEKGESLPCDSCSKTFPRVDLLARHKATKHPTVEGDDDFDAVLKEKKFECHVCLKSFTTQKYRDVHVKGHLGDKRYKCRICDKCFLSKSHLTEHIKFHDDHSKKFLCSECGQRFIRNDYLVIHMRRHRGEKPFKCKFCGKGFPRTTDLTVHERYHTGEKTHLCTICGRGFGRAYNLTVHMRTHTGEKPYQCTYCDAAFAQGNDLKAHVRRHTGERFHCELCSESFLMGYLLTQHKRNVHGLNVVSNIRRLQPVSKIKEDIDEPPPITIPLPKPVVPSPDILLTHLQIGHHMAQE